MRVFLPGLLLLSCCPLLCAQPSATAPQAAGGAFATGRHRNLFREGGHSDQDIRKKIDAAFQQLFHGDPATQAVFYWAGQNGNGRLAYLSDINNRDVRSEGMSYGMMITVQLDKKPEFDALWNWSRTFMFHDAPAHPAYGFFSWSMKTDGTPNSESPAPDGEEYYVMALYFASARWGDGQGIYDYRAMADRLLSDIKNRGVISGPWASRPDRIETDGAQFNLEETNHSPALVATNAVASLAATHPRAARFVDALWNAEIPAGQFRYYDGLWHLMGLMHCSGEYRIWTPKWAGR
jgi:endo-1,4-beta-D-glucanase Y